MSASNFRHNILILFFICLKAKQKPNHIKLPMYYYHFKDTNWFSKNKKINPTCSLRNLLDVKKCLVHSFFRLTFKSPRIDVKIAML